jgi:hypothetical protein
VKSYTTFIIFNKAYRSFGRELLSNILTEFDIPQKAIWLADMCPNEIHSKDHTDKYFSDAFTVQLSETSGFHME